MLAGVLLRRALAAGDGSLSAPHQPRLSPDTSGRGAGRRALRRAQLGKRLSHPARATSRAITRRLGTCCPRPCAPAAPSTPPLRRALAQFSAGALQSALGWRTGSAGESEGVGREVRASAFSPHSSGGVQSSGWDVLPVAVEAAAAREAPEPHTLQPERKGKDGRE